MGCLAASGALVLDSLLAGILDVPCMVCMLAGGIFLFLSKTGTLLVTLFFPPFPSSTAGLVIDDKIRKVPHTVSPSLMSLAP